MDRVELNIRFYGTAEEADRLVQHTESWADFFEASSQITIELIPVDEEHDPYVGADEILDYASSEEYGSALGAKVVRSIGRYASCRNLIVGEGVSAITERDGTPYIHEDLLKLAATDTDEFRNLGKKSAVLLSSFFEYREKSQVETE